jgi:alpha-ketoglutarate-dependent taurine dioxygenase
MGGLPEGAVAHYREHGYYAPIRVMPVAEAEKLRGRLEAHEAGHGELRGAMRHKSHLLFTWLDRLIRHPAILDAVESVSFRLDPGDMIIFNSGHYLHRVTPVVGSTVRWTACSFMAESKAGDRVYCWG